MPRQFQQIDIADIIRPSAIEVPDQLRNSIARVGVINPITVRETDDGMYTIIAGLRRYQVLLESGATDIPAMVISNDESDDDDNFITYTENMARSQNIVGEIDAIRRLAVDHGLSLEEIQERFHLRGTPFLHRARVAFIPNQGHRGVLLGAIVEGVITLSTAAWIGTLSVSNRRRAVEYLQNRRGATSPITRRAIQTAVEGAIANEGQPALEGMEAMVVDVDELSESMTMMGGAMRNLGDSFSLAAQAVAPEGFVVQDPPATLSREPHFEILERDTAGRASVIRLMGLRNFRWLREDRVRADVRYEYVNGNVSAVLLPQFNARFVREPVAPATPDFWWRSLPRQDENHVTRVLVDDIRGTRGWASVAALLEAAESALPQDDTGLADEIAAKINGLMNRLTQHYTRNVRPPTLPQATVVGVDLAAREEVRAGG